MSSTAAMSATNGPMTHAVTMHLDASVVTTTSNTTTAISTTTPTQTALPSTTSASTLASASSSVGEFLREFEVKFEAGKKAIKASLQDTIAQWTGTKLAPIPAPKKLVRIPHHASVTYRPPMRDADDSRLYSSERTGTMGPMSSAEHELTRQSIDIELSYLQENRTADEYGIEMYETDCRDSSIMTQSTTCTTMTEVGAVIHSDECQCHLKSHASFTNTSMESSPEDREESTEISRVNFHSCSSSTTPFSSPRYSTCSITGIVVAHHSPELEDGRWIDANKPHPSHLIPKAPYRICQCLIPWRSLRHLHDHHLQPLSHARNIEFEGHQYPEWRGMHYPNGEPKSVLRGVPHELAFIAVIIYAGFLFSSVQSPAGWLASAIQIFTQLLLYGTSSQFHRRIWSMTTYNRMKRLDHSAIFLLAAGTSSPTAILMIRDQTGMLNGHMQLAGWFLLGWGLFGALTGVFYSIFKPLRGRVSLFGLIWMGIVGACMVPFVYPCYVIMTPLEFGMIVTAWLLYLLSILTYSHQWCNFYPAILGYHEVFHIITIMGGVAVGTFNYTICTRMK